MNAVERIKEIFSQALEKKTGTERAVFVSEACGGDCELRREVESLLLANAGAGEFLGKTMVLSRSDFTIERSGTMIGRYKLLQRIGEGGFGVVYMAEQIEPVQRKVALKVIKAGMDTREVVARFEAERQALALMDHPNIARVFDAGATETGRPYFVMELVNGIPITDYCDREQLSTTQRLQLFMKVCHAVQHAHQKGIIHRDLKPNNVLVTLHDGEPVPKVIDFGVAKALGQKLTGKTLFTPFQNMIGTPAYMSPEQAELSGLDIDTRSDIYSLGVLLYELLTGVTPFDAETLRQAALDEIRRMIREAEPAKPSTRLRTLGEKLAEVATRRHTDPMALKRLVRGDLDRIVMKCLEKNRQRRYETPDALSQDLRRHLNDEPVLACPPSFRYLFARFVRRHRVAVGVVSALVFTVLCGTSVSVWQATRANRQAELAELRRADSEASRLAATEAQIRAERFAKEASHALARQYVDKGAQRLDEGDYFAALVWFTQALRLDEGDSASATVHRLRIDAVLQQCPRLLQTFIHRGAVASVHFSPDGKRLLTAGADNTARVWDVNTGLPGPVLHHSQLVTSASFSSDSRRIVTASYDRTARIWDATTGAELTPPLQHASNVLWAVFAEDGRRVVTASMDQTARIWNAMTGEPATPALRHQGAVWPASFSPDGRLVVTASDDATARIWDAETGQPATPPLQHPGAVFWVAFSPDGQLVATACEDHNARIWDAHTGKLRISSLSHGEEVTYVAFSPNGERLVTACGETIFRAQEGFKNCRGEARVWDVATGKAITPPIQHRLSVFYAAFSPDGRRVVTASHDRTARVWDPQTGKPLTPPLLHGHDVFRAAFSPDGRLLATASFDGLARIWDTGDVQRKPLSLRDSKFAGKFNFSGDGGLIIGKYLGNGARVWNALTGLPMTPLLHDTNLFHVGISRDGRFLATAGADSTARIWDAHTGKPTTRPMVHNGDVVCVEFSPDGKRVVTASEDQSARIWDAHTGAALTSPLRHPSNVLCATFSPDGRRIATTSEDKTARVWDAATGAAITPPLIHAYGVRLALFNADGSRLATASWDGNARVWDANTGQPVTPSMKQGGRWMLLNGIETMSFSPDGHYLVIGDSDGTARVWDANTGEPMTPPLRHSDSVNYAAFSRTGSFVVTTSCDKTARVWDAITGQPITPPLSQEGPVDSARFAPDDRSLQTVCNTDEDGAIATWELKSEDRPTKELVTLAESLSLHYLDSSGAFLPIPFEALTNVLRSPHQ
jgi:WD40 repeat protein